MYRVGADIILISPSNDVIRIYYKLGFEITNNMVEYERLILGKKVIIVLKIKHLKIYGDSQLVNDQVNNIYNTKYEKLYLYNEVVVDLVDHF